MNEIEWIIVIAVGELAVILMLALSLLFYFGLRGRRRDTNAAQTLVRKVAKAQPRQRESLQAYLTAAGLDDAEREAEVQRVLALEQAFYEHCIRAYLTRDSEAFSTTDEKLTAVLKPFIEHGQSADAAAAASAAATETAPLADDDQHLYREALNHLFREYAALFGVRLDAAETLDVNDILQRLESGKLAGL